MRRVAFVIACVLTVASTGAPAQEIPLEYRVKAAYLLNFTRFVEWPEPQNKTAPLVVCLAEENPFGSVLATMIQGETTAGRPLALRTVTDGNISSCGVLFIPRSVPSDPHLEAVGRSAILTVGESPEFLRMGGMIGFVLEKGRVRFAINHEASSRNGLTVSSRLLQLAQIPGGSE